MQSITLAMIVLTAALLWWHRLGMVRVLEISTRNGHAVEARDDRGDGGVSRASLSAKDPLVFTCTLAKSAYAWPYCGVHFLLGRDASGVDLSVFDHMTFVMDQ